MRFDVTIIGSNSAIPAHGRHPSAQLLNINEKYYLIDCGEGTQINLNRFRLKKSRINYIFISHLHGDHYFGLIGLLTTLNLLGRQHPLYLFGPSELQEILDLQLKVSDLKLKYELVFRSLRFDKAEQIMQNDEIKVVSVPLNHRIPCVGFIFKEKKHQRNYLPEQGEKYNIPVEAITSLKKGKDYTTPSGEIVKSEWVTKSPPKPRKYAYITDTTYYEPIISKIQYSDLLYHEATFVKELAERAKNTYHTTSAQAATMASKGKVEKLLIGHFSAKYKELQQLLDEAQEIFPNTELALEGKTFSIEQKSGD